MARHAMLGVMLRMVCILAFCFHRFGGSVDCPIRFVQWNLEARFLKMSEDILKLSAKVDPLL